MTVHCGSLSRSTAEEEIFSATTIFIAIPKIV